MESNFNEEMAHEELKSAAKMRCRLASNMSQTINNNVKAQEFTRNMLKKHAKNGQEPDLSKFEFFADKLKTFQNENKMLRDQYDAEFGKKFYNFFE